jgi:hypothetical protein
MSLVLEWSDQAELSPNVRRLRAHVAVVRTLLDELERAAPSFGGPVDMAKVSCRAEYLAEELVRLAGRMNECAAVAALLAASAAAPHFECEGATSAASGAEPRALRSVPGTAHRVVGPTLIAER